MFVIGKAKSPRCFKRVKHLPCQYRSQKKSWMDGILFEDWVREIDRQFTKERRNIVLFVENCLARPTINNLVSIELIFLPPNTTSNLQPMDQGVIRSLKAHYRALSVRKWIDAIEKEKPLPEFSVLDAMPMLDVAWGKVKAETIGNCFAKAGISEKKQADALLDADDPFKDLQDQLDKLAVHTSEFFPEGTTAKDVVSMDDFVNTTEPIMNDEEIISNVLDEENLEAEEDKDGDVDILIEPTCPQSGDVRQALEVLRRYMVFSDNGVCIHKCINRINSIVENEL